MLIEEEDNEKGEDRWSLGNLNALDGIYMYLPATLGIPGIHNRGVCR
jgi:hypothetical protein